MTKIQEELEKFVVNNDDLEKLEIELSKFNLFEKLSLEHYEIRHSNTLAYLFNPKEDHGLSDYFLKKFLMSVYSDNNMNISPIAIDSMSFSDAIIKREYKNIDLLIISNSNKIVICIENKIFSSESGTQLKDYKDTVNDIYSDFNKSFIFLSPTGVEPLDMENWAIADYEIVNKILTNILTLKSNDLGDQQNIFLTHYLEIIRRYLLENANEKELARKIYNNHKKALDFIYDNIADQRGEVFNFIEELIKKDDNLVINYSTKSRIRFQTKSMDMLSKIGDGSWNKIKELFLYEVQNNSDFISIILVMGPGKKEIRGKIFDELSKGFLKKYLKTNTKLSNKFNTIYKQIIVSKEEYENIDFEDIKSKIIEFFINSHLNCFSDIDNYFEQIKPLLI